MAETTTVRVRTSTRDELNALSTERGEPVEAVIRDGIALLRREQWRRQAEIDARAAAADPEDRAEVASVLRDLAG
jgi:predicted transcriptional regulator